MTINLFPENIALNLVGGVKKIQLIGRNAAISNSAETIWTPSGTYAQLTTAVAMEAVSSSANDAAAGTGARTIEVDLVDGNYVQTTVTVTMNGVTPVAITGTFLAVNGARVITAGSGLTNAGDIDIRVVTGSVVKSRISSAAGSTGISQDFVYTVPANTIALLKPVTLTAQAATGSIFAYVNTYNSSGVFRTVGLSALSLQGVGVQKGDMNPIGFGYGLRIEPRTLIELRAIASAGNGDLMAMADLLLFNQITGPLAL